MAKLKKIIFLSMIFSTIMISACTKNDTETSTTSTPDDFAISFYYGINDNQYNMLDTYIGEIQKDLISNGKKNIDYVIPEDDLNDIYTQICKYKVYEITDYMTSPELSFSPISRYEISFTINGVDYYIAGDYSAMFYQNKSEQANNFCDFVTYMTDYIEETDEYKSLPEAEGGYL